MKDISAIKRQALKRENKVDVEPTTNLILGIETPNQNAILTVEKFQLNKKLGKAVANKRAELEKTKETIESSLTGASQEAARILHEARTKAKTILTLANASRNDAENLLQQNQSKQKQLEETEQSLVKRESESKQKQELVDIATKDVNRKQELVDKSLEIASSHKTEIVDMLVTTLALLEATVENISQVQKLEGEAKNGVSQTLAKADRMMERTVTLISEIDVDKSLLNQKAIELQNREKLLADRTQQFDRAQKEMRQK